jgi:F-type H+-transporting ATPase subunit gamma
MRRSEDIRNQLGNIEQIESVVVAMRAMAVAHASEARKHITAIREQRANVMLAMEAALALLPEPVSGEKSDGSALWIVFGAALGFSGSYSGRLVAAALDKGTQSRFILIGQRCIAECAGRGLTPVWSADTVAHCMEVPALASRIADALFEQITQGAADRVGLLYVDPDSAAVQSVPLMPFDFSQVPRDRRPAPLTTLAPQDLLSSLVTEYIFTALCEGLMMGFGAENNARMAAMTRARSNVHQIRSDLTTEFAQARQDQMTNEIMELIATS